MAHSTSLDWHQPEPGSPPGDPHRLRTLASFYRWQAGLYDWTRPLILMGRNAVIEGLEVAAGQRVLDVGCGTGWSLPRLAARGAEVIGIEPSPAMFERARRRVRRLESRTEAVVRLDPRAYGSHDDYAGQADRALFSYSLSMMPHYRDVLVAARRDLAPEGRIGVVDFLHAGNGTTRRWLETCHVELGPERLEALVQLFPRHTLGVRSTPLWSYFTFWGSAS